MFLLTQRVLEDNKAAWSANSKFTANHATLAESIASIAEEQKQQEADKTGIAQDKEAAREDLTAQAFYMASGIRSFAADERNKELEQAVKYTESGLGRMAETRLISTCEMIHRHGTGHLAGLTEYGVTSGTLADLKTAIDGYKKVQPDARLAINTGSLATARLRKRFTATSDLLRRQLDTKMVPFKKSNGDFHSAYFRPATSLGLALQRNHRQGRRGGAAPCGNRWEAPMQLGHG